MKYPSRAGHAAAVALAAVIVASLWISGCRTREKADEAPAAAASESETPKAEKEGWEPLFDGKTLGKWKLSDFWKPGKVHVEEDNLVLERGKGDLTGVFWGGDPNMLPRIDYEIQLQAQRVEGSDFFCGLTFPYKKDCASLIVGGWGGGVVGISSFDGMDASMNETATYMEFENGRWYTIRLRVTDNHIQAWIDDKKVVDAEPGNRDVDVRIEVEVSKSLSEYQTLTPVHRNAMRPKTK